MDWIFDIPIFGGDSFIILTAAGGAAENHKKKSD